VSGARVVVADEPTAELDTASGRAVLEAVRHLRERGVTFVLATHDPAVMRAADVLLRLDHGEVVDPRRTHPGAAPLAGRPSAVEEDAGTVLRLTDVAKTYRRGTDLVHAVDGVSLRCARRACRVDRTIRVRKTTLLNLVAGWERADRGEIEGPGAAAANGTTQWRHIAVVPQKLGLIDELTVRENVAHPAKLAGSLDEHADRVEELLERVGLADLAGRHPSEASVGEQQRAAMARRCCSIPPGDRGRADRAPGPRDERSSRPSGTPATPAPRA
jgi:ABC-type lipoprotein export system ATPase subunit